VFFFRGSARKDIRAVWRGEMQFGRGKAKTIFAGGKGFALPRLFLFWAVLPPRRKVREECAAGSLDFSLFKSYTTNCK